jgi:hypothetical protein
VPDTGTAQYRVRFINPVPNYVFTNPFEPGSDSTNQSVADPNSGYTSYFVLKPGQIKMTVNSGVKPAQATLPVKLGDFYGKYADGFTRLQWYTLTESNTNHFEIERSTDGQHFEIFGKVNANNYSNSRLDYSYIDLLAKQGMNYYRLKLVDNDGNFEYSKVIAFNTEFKGISLLMVFPNLFGQKVQVRIESEKKDQITLRVTNSAGAVVRLQINAGENNIVLKNVANLPGGMYILEVISSTKTFSTTIMKQ